MTKFFFENIPYLPQKNRWFKKLITGQPVEEEKNKKFYISQIYLATHSKKPFVDISCGHREKWLSRVGPVKKKAT